ICGTFDNNCTALHFDTVNILITTGTGLGQISAMGPGQRSSVVENQTAQTHFPQKNCLHFPAQFDVFCRMPDGEQGLQGHSKEALFECYLKPRRANDTHTVDIHYVGLQMQSIQMCDEKYDDILNY